MMSGEIATLQHDLIQYLVSYWSNRGLKKKAKPVLSLPRPRMFYRVRRHRTSGTRFGQHRLATLNWIDRFDTCRVPTKFGCDADQHNGAHEYVPPCFTGVCSRWELAPGRREMRGG